ncbi:MAG: hypothetical protein M5U01_20750 [Ardenticatenaceae bacterium]|nr:hypothetical protein [Ardenticatenaceae bacterium]
MYPDTRQTIYMGINFITSPEPIVDKRSHITFQQSLLTHGVDFDRAEQPERQIVVVREAPTRLLVKVVSTPSIGQLLVVSEDPRADLDLELFSRNVEATVAAFEATWPARNRQLIRSDATFRDLFETSAEHAFQELWEVRLHQPADSLAVLGRPVLGGGLRFVMPAQSNEADPVQIEVKIESFLQDSKKIFVETQFVWSQSAPPAVPLNGEQRLKQVDAYIGNTVIPFITGEDR